MDFTGCRYSAVTVPVEISYGVPRRPQATSVGVDHREPLLVFQLLRALLPRT